jgi:hypothetical protein
LEAGMLNTPFSSAEKSRFLEVSAFGVKETVALPKTMLLSPSIRLPEILYDWAVDEIPIPEKKKTSKEMYLK